MNLYDRCTFNKTVIGKQITIQFFVDDLKVSHVDNGVFKKEIEKLDDKFRTNTQQLNVTKGDVHDYLGLTLDYSHDSYVKITMYDFIQNILPENKRLTRFCRDDPNTSSG